MRAKALIFYKNAYKCIKIHAFLFIFVYKNAFYWAGRARPARPEFRFVKYLAFF